jgi:hypothetical protein
MWESDIFWAAKEEKWDKLKMRGPLEVVGTSAYASEPYGSDILLLTSNRFETSCQAQAIAESTAHPRGPLQHGAQ